MKPSILVTTDFTDSSRNALEYTCGLVSDRYDLVLLHIYNMPVSYSAEGVAFAAIQSDIRDADELIEQQLAWIKGAYPAIHVEGKVAIGGFIHSLKHSIADLMPEIVVMGAKKEYDELGLWNSDFLDALVALPIPVLIVPQHVRYSPIHNIGFACDYREPSDEKQVSFIKRTIMATGAQLHVVHISRTQTHEDETKKRNEAALQLLLQDVAPKYYAVEDPNVIDAIARFVKEHALDMLIVVPHRHGFWHSLFNQSHTRQLAKLNNLPMLALHDQ